MPRRVTYDHDDSETASDSFDFSLADGGNVVSGNYIGTNQQGTAAIANLNGVVIENVPTNVIGQAGSRGPSI